MANDLLITAIRAAGLTVEDVSRIAGADSRTVQRWLSGRVPHPGYRSKVALALGVEERELWPETRRTRNRDRLEEIAGAWPLRSDPDAPDWRALLARATEQIDLIGYSLMSIAEARAINKTLTGKARAGCPVRIALADPDAGHVTALDARRRVGGRLADRINEARRRLEPLAGEDQIEIRQHQVATSHTIVRFDHHMLLTIHTSGTPGFQAPLLHLRRERDYGIFDQLAAHIESVWQSAVPIGTEATRPGATPPATPPNAPDELLDQLDYVWRPAR